ncbi:MAG: YibE/F family protein [Candidatus Nanopelagicales bacterium]|nr:YibE/F family protein [Candidatus Nanopelagicales bacterium]
MSIDNSIFGYVDDSEFYTVEVQTIKKFDCIANGATQDASGNFTTAPCANISAKLLTGPNAEQIVTFDVQPTIVDFGIHSGDKISVASFPTDSGTQYIFNDFERTNGIFVLFGVFLLVLVLTAGLGGLRALVGLGLTFGLLIVYLIPSLIQGQQVVYVVGGVVLSITAFVLYLVHGFSLKTGAAIVGTLTGSMIAIIGALWSTDALRLTGITGDEDLILSSIASQVKLSNLLIASMVIAGFGALNDVTVTQSSAVWELASSSEKQNWRQLFLGGMRIGRDHIASSIYTIAFAYVGAALVTLMLIVASSPPLARLINDEVVAQELALIMVGSIALALSTPITTACAAWFAVKIAKQEQ